MIATQEAEYLSVKEVASRLRVSQMSVYRLINEGALGSVRVGRNFRIPTQAYADFVEANTRPMAVRDFDLPA